MPQYSTSGFFVLDDCADTGLQHANTKPVIAINVNIRTAVPQSDVQTA